MFYGPQNQQLKTIGIAGHIIGALVICAGGPLAYYLLSQPLIEETSEHLTRLETYDRSIASAATIHGEHKEVEEQLIELEKRTQAVRQRIPHEPKEAEFLGDLSRIAAEENIVIQDYRRDRVIRGDKYSQLVVGLQMNGIYEDICSLLERLAHLPRVTAVQRLEIDTKHADQTLPVNITLILYYGLDVAGQKEES